ncbi:MAG TPA: MarR family transcriptional regulator [Ktedonobacteraceae bacterium]|nr:MarR family transcriptional regulator [Ktedonobacteraceae bacterium]
MTTDRLVDDMLAIYHLIRRASHPVHRAEMTQEQYWLLLLLRRRGALTIGELAEVLGVTGSSVTTACKRLEKAGLVTRERQSDDERMVRVVLTEQGSTRVESWQQQRRALLAHLLAPLNQREQETLQRLLECILEAADVPQKIGVTMKDAYDRG